MPLLPAGWYVTRDNMPPGHTGFMTGVSVNDINTWDVTRLGWVKVGRGRGQLLTHNLEQLSGHFSPTVTNCYNADIDGHFPGAAIDKTEVGGRSVTEEFPFISRVHTWQRHVELDHAQSPVLSLTLQHSHRVGVTVKQSESHVKDFSGVLYQVEIIKPSRFSVYLRSDFRIQHLTTT